MPNVEFARGAAAVTMRTDGPPSRPRTERIVTTSILIYLATGAYAGFMAGLLGVGGGVIIVPALLFVFALQGVPDADAVRMAIATSLASIAFTSVSSMRAHHARGAVDWGVVRRIAPGIVAGTFGGAFVAAALPAIALKVFFVVFLACIAAQMALDYRPPPARALPGAAGMTAAGAFIGTLSSLVGIGGGVMTVPFLAWCNVAVHRAIGTSSAVGFPLALAGSAGFVVAGGNADGLSPGAFGYVYLPALAGIVLVSVFLAPVGAWVAHRQRAVVLKRVFSVFLIAVGAKLAAGLEIAAM